MTQKIYNSILLAAAKDQPCLAILIDPEKFNLENTANFLETLPNTTTHLLVGGSTVEGERCEQTVASLKNHTALPIVLFPGDYHQITPKADAVLFLSLLSGRNPEYLIGQQVKAVRQLEKLTLEVIPTAYLLIDGGTESAVAHVSETQAMPQEQIEAIVHTAKAGEYMGAQLIYLEAGSGAIHPVHPAIISAVKEVVQIPLIVGGGIRTEAQKMAAYQAGAHMVVMGTAYETNHQVDPSTTNKNLIA